jgi:ATP-binding cassette subfamily B protein
MAWGGGGGFGGGVAMGRGVGNASQQAAAAGLPFGGIPEELQEGVDKLLAKEPEHDDADRVTFDRQHYDRRPLTLRRFLAPHWLAMLGGFALVMGETFAMQAGPLLTKIGIDDGITPGNLGVVWLMAGLYVLAVVLNWAFAFARTAWTGRVGERLMFEMRVRLFGHFQRLSLDYFTGEKAGRLISRMTSDVESLTQLFREGLVQLVVQGMTLVIVTAVLFSMNVRLAALILFAVVPVMVVLTLWFRSRSDKGYEETRDRIADVLTHLSESLAGIRVVTADNRQVHNTIEHRNIVGYYLRIRLYTARVAAIYGPGTQFIGVAGQAFVLIMGGRMVLSGALTIGELTAFVLYLNAFFAPIQQLVQLYDTYQRGQAGLSKLSEVLTTEPTVAEKPGAAELPPIKGEITFEGVTFGYDAKVPVLHGVDLTIADGETFALVGPTGAGKSTIAKLVTRFYDPTEGTVYIDGHELPDVTLASLRRQLGVVPQEPFLFAGSIRDNIAFSRPDASDDEVLEACRVVGIDDLVARLPDSIHTPCHERGVSLSSGERQLLALARAFLAHPRVLVLDEATSNLDLLSETKIERALDVLLEGRTAIIIAHRLATAMRADRIAVVLDGQITELGSHDELVAVGGYYASMFAAWQAQAAGEHVRMDDVLATPDLKPLARRT